MSQKITSTDDVSAPPTEDVVELSRKWYDYPIDKITEIFEKTYYYDLYIKNIDTINDLIKSINDLF